MTVYVVGFSSTGLRRQISFSPLLLQSLNGGDATRQTVAGRHLPAAHETFSLCVLFAVATQSLCHADITKLSAEDRKLLQDFSRFHEVHATSELPPAVIALYADNGRLAEPGQKWQATDVIVDSTLPGKRLIWAAVGGEYYVVHYERGGIDHRFHILVAKLTEVDAKPTVVWRALGGPFKDYAAFLDVLRTGKLDDRLDYAHSARSY